MEGEGCGGGEGVRNQSTFGLKGGTLIYAGPTTILKPSVLCLKDYTTTPLDTHTCMHEQVITPVFKLSFVLIGFLWSLSS